MTKTLSRDDYLQIVRLNGFSHYYGYDKFHDVDIDGGSSYVMSIFSVTQGGLCTKLSLEKTLSFTDLRKLEMEAHSHYKKDVATKGINKLIKIECLKNKKPESNSINDK